jgi:4-amino-4-deoxy-L-arabinose transferase-like glycosyltransferase
LLAEPAAPPVAARPALLPSGRRARWCLALLVGFVLLKGLVWAVTVPAFWAADEDYHFLYVESLTTQRQLPAPDRPLYPEEYGKLLAEIHYDDYGQGPRREFDGDPHRSVGQLEKLPESARDATFAGRGVGVVHPPLYPLLGAAVNAAAGDASVLTRLTLVRFVSALIGALAVYLGWLLAAQVLTRFLHQFMAAFLLAVQPMFSYMTGVVNHDVALVACFSAALALMLFAMRSPPRAAQGLWLGGAVALALLIKASALALLPLAALAYAAQALVHRAAWREVARSAAVAGVVVLAVAGWWYVRSKILYGSFTGATTSIADTTQSALAPAERGLSASSPGELIGYAREWIAFTYRTYWWHFMWFDAPPTSSPWFYVPMAVGLAGTAGLARLAWLLRRTLLDPERPELRQIVLLLSAVLAVLVPFLAVDVVRRADGLGFMLNGGRYLIPVYGGVAVMMIVGLRGLVGVRLWTIAGVAVSAVAVLFNLRVYDFHYLNRYYGFESTGELLRRLSFDHPEFVTPVTIAGTAVVAAVLAAGAWLLAWQATREESSIASRT